MGYGILSEDMLAICLLFAKGDVMMPMGEIISRIEEFQCKHGFFGVSDTDIRCAFMHLAEVAGNVKIPEKGIRFDSENPREMFGGLLLRDFIKPVLGLSGIWFNDEGESWDSYDDYPPTSRNRLLQEYFSGSENQKPEDVMDFLQLYGWSIDKLDDYHCSGGGNLYDDWVFGDLEHFLKKIGFP